MPTWKRLLDIPKRKGLVDHNQKFQKGKEAKKNQEEEEEKREDALKVKGKMQEYVSRNPRMW